MKEILIREPTIADNKVLAALSDLLGYSIDSKVFKINDNDVN